MGNQGDVSGDLGLEDLSAYRQVQERIKQTFSDPTYQPPKLPAVALELLELARKPDFEVKDVVSLLEKDPVLASRLLRHVRSPLYAERVEMRSLQRALTHLGLDHIRNIAIELTVGARVFRAEHYIEAMDRVAKHSRRTAYLTQAVCRYAARDASYAFLCGLLHDVGLAAGLIALGDVPRNQDRPEIEVVLPVLYEMHADLGAQVAQSWQLAPEVVEVIRHHHELVGPDGKVHQIAAVVCLAEYLANELVEEGSIAGPDGYQPQSTPVRVGAAYDRTSPEQVALASDTLGLDVEKMKQLRTEALKIVLFLETPQSPTDVDSGCEIPVPASPQQTTKPASTSATHSVKRNEGPEMNRGEPVGFWGRVRDLFRN